MSGPQYRGGASVAQKKQFLQGTSKTKKDSGQPEIKQERHEEVALTGVFRIEHPINTCLGPIGQFIMEPDALPKHPSILFYGKRRTGKSYSARWILYKCFSDYPFGICCSGTSYNGFWQQYIPDNLVFQGLDDRALTVLIKRQTELIKQWRKDHPNQAGDAYKDDPALRAFVILGKQSFHCNCSSFLRGSLSEKFADDFSNFWVDSFVNDGRGMPRPEGVADVENDLGGFFQLMGIFDHYFQSNDALFR
jgi:hypothetical protein